MTILTKILVVLTMIAAVVLVAVVVPFVARTQNYQEALAQAVQDREAARARARSLENTIANLDAGESERFAQLTAEKTSLTAQINQMMEELSATRNDLLTEKATSSGLSANNSALIAQNRQMAEITNTLQDELTQRRERMVKQETDLIQLSARNDSLESQLDTLTRSVRRFREQMTVLQDRNEQLENLLARVDPDIRAALTSGASEEAVTFMPNIEIRGSITGIAPLVNQTLVQLDLGSNDMVEENMKFLIHRNNVFMGTLVITQVEPEASVARVASLQPDVVIEVGDQVYTGSPD